MKKIVSLILIAVLFLMAAIPVTAATSVTGAVIGHLPTVVSQGQTELAPLRFIETTVTAGSIRSGNEITVVLPSGVVFRHVYKAAESRVTPLFESPLNNMVVSHPTVNAGDNSVTLTLNRVADIFTPAQFVLRFPVNIAKISNGPISVAVTTNTTAINDGNFNIGVFNRAVITVSGTGNIGAVSRSISELQGGGMVLRLKENAPGAFSPGVNNPVVLKLPEGIIWNDSPVVTGGIAAVVNPHNRRELFLSIAAPTTTATTFTVQPRIIVTRLAALGEIAVKVEGRGENINKPTGETPLARVADFDIGVIRPAGTTIPVVNAGQFIPATSNIIALVENIRGSLIPGGTITLSLPEGAVWNVGPTVSATDVSVNFQGIRVSDSIYKFTVINTTNNAGTVRFSLPANAVAISPDVASGNLVVSVRGSAGATGEVIISAIRSPFEIVASGTPRLNIATTNQSAGNINISEDIAGGIPHGIITLRLPAGISFTKATVVTVTSGNIAVGTPVLTNNMVSIPVNSISTTPSNLVISGIRYNVDRFASEGNVAVMIGGITNPFIAERFPVQAVNARIGGRQSSVFTVGASSFVRDGQNVNIDASPVIQNGRTLLPLRFAALAGGVNEDNIVWNPKNRTITVIYNERIVQFRIGENTIIINGASVPIDTPPSIRNGRTLVPIRALALALGASVTWDKSTKTITVITP